VKKFIQENSFIVEKIKQVLDNSKISYSFEETDTEFVFNGLEQKHVYALEKKYNLYYKFEGYSRIGGHNRYDKMGFKLKKESNMVMFDSIFDNNRCKSDSYSLKSVLFMGRVESRGNLNNLGFKIPEYQRDLVWSPENEVNLIDTMLKGMPVGLFIFNKKHTEDYADSWINVVDGQQRLNTIKKFMNDEITDSFGRCYSDISSIERSRFNNISISVVIMDDASEKDEIKAYIQANDTGINHTREEIQKAYELLKEKQ
jgi:hypothetical protein